MVPRPEFDFESVEKESAALLLSYREQIKGRETSQETGNFKQTTVIPCISHRNRQTVSFLISPQTKLSSSALLRELLLSITTILGVGGLWNSIAL